MDSFQSTKNMEKSYPQASQESIHKQDATDLMVQTSIKQESKWSKKSNTAEKLQSHKEAMLGHDVGLG